MSSSWQESKLDGLLVVVLLARNGKNGGLLASCYEYLDHEVVRRSCGLDVGSFDHTTNLFSVL
jgi:hypothetical protein